MNNNENYETMLTSRKHRYLKQKFRKKMVRQFDRIIKTVLNLHFLFRIRFTHE